MNVEYRIIPICIPDNDTDYLKVCDFTFGIFTRDDETGRIIEPMQAEKDAMTQAAQIYRWDGRTSFVYGFSTGGGIVDNETAKKANNRLINKLRGMTRRELMNSKY